MKAMKHLLAAAFVFGSVFAGSAVAAEKTAEPVQLEQPAVQNSVGDKVNINTATAAEIQKALVGIGAKKAEAVREKHGNFSAVEQLLEVQGIGKATLEKNRDRIAL